MSPAKTAFAVKCSLAVLKSISSAEPSPDSIPEIPSLPVSGMVYLWTFTTPDQVDVSTLSKRWTALTQRFRDKKMPVQWMRFFEPHPGGHGWHVHTVAVTRYDVTTIRKLAVKFGFGRLNVKQIPSSKAGYVLKYVIKFHRQKQASRRRLWACNGFKGVPVSTVRIFDSLLDYCYSRIGYKEVSKYSLDYIWKNGLNDWLSATHYGEPTTTKDKKMNTFSPAQEKKIISLAASGNRIAVAEYRGTKIREARKYIDGRASLSEKSYYAAHLFEANASPLLVEALLPDSFKPEVDKVKEPASKGQMCVLVINKVSNFGGKETHQADVHAL